MVCDHYPITSDTELLVLYSLLTAGDGSSAISNVSLVTRQAAFLGVHARII
jgi:hypothetical protein